MGRQSLKDKAETAKFVSESVKHYVDVGRNLIEPGSIGVITGWIYVKIGGSFKSWEDFLAHVEKTIVPPIVLMTVVASNGGLAATLVKTLLTSQLMTLIAMVELEKYYDEEKKEWRWKLSVMDRLFIAAWVPLIYLLLIRGGQSTGGGLELPFIG